MKIMKEKKGIAKLFLLVLVFFLGMFFVEGIGSLQQKCRVYGPDFNKNINNYDLSGIILPLTPQPDTSYILLRSKTYVKFDQNRGTWEFSFNENTWKAVDSGGSWFIGSNFPNQHGRRVLQRLAKDVKELKELKNECEDQGLFGSEQNEEEEEEESIDGECGPAERNYEHNEEDFTEPFCDKGELSGNEPNFPEPGDSVTWICEGINGGSRVTCEAKRGPMPQDDDNGEGDEEIELLCDGSKPEGNAYHLGDKKYPKSDTPKNIEWTYVPEDPGTCEFTCEEDYEWDGDKEECIEKQEEPEFPDCNKAEVEEKCICRVSGPFEDTKVQNKNYCHDYCDNCYEGTNCYCPDNCVNAMWILNKEVDTCGGVDLFSCTSLGGECMTEEECIEKHEDDFDKSNHIINEAEDCDFVCCKMGDGNQRNLRDCSTFCSNPDGCICNKNCQNRASANLSQFDVTRGEDYEVPIHFNCLGYHRDDPFRLAECNNEERDGVCPAHCFWWNDLDCGVQANIVDVLWDYTGLTDWWAETQFVQKLQNFANYLDLNYWAESICNPLVKIRQEVEPITDGYFTHYETQGWISGIMDLYNETHYVYTKSYYLTNLIEDNHYRMEYRGDDTIKYPFEESEKTYEADDNYWFNVTASSVVQNTSITIIDENEYEDICMVFKYEIDLGGLTHTGQGKIKEVCRGINVEW